MLIDFAGQSDILLYDNQDYRRLIIDDLGPNDLKIINSQIKNIWQEFQILKKTREEKIQSLKRKEDNNFAIKD